MDTPLTPLYGHFNQTLAAADTKLTPSQSTLLWGFILISKIRQALMQEFAEVAHNSSQSIIDTHTIRLIVIDPLFAGVC